MCWNADISINTFIFACMGLIFIFLASFTKYRLEAFKNPLVYLFYFSGASMQLIEYFLWKNINNKSINKLLSIFALLLILIQIGIIILIIENTTIKYCLLLFFILFTICVNRYTSLNPKQYHTSIAKNGHLSWDWFNFENTISKIIVFIYLGFYVFASLFINNIEITVMIILTLFITLLFYYKEKTFTSVWCWSTNLFLIYFIVKILIIKPYYEYNKLC
uniref:Uncharacterized protein n=1 Tax=viral metagenome TaxID=1070528 RepID=A0A6C0D4C4_9ZZZZ